MSCPPSSWLCSKIVNRTCSQARSLQTTSRYYHYPRCKAWTTDVVQMQGQQPWMHHRNQGLGRAGNGARWLQLPSANGDPPGERWRVQTHSSARAAAARAMRRSPPGPSRAMRDRAPAALRASPGGTSLARAATSLEDAFRASLALSTPGPRSRLFKPLVYQHWPAETGNDAWTDVCRCG